MQKRLVVVKRRGGKSAGGKPLLPVAPPASEILSAEWKGEKRGDFKCVKAYWHDQGKARREEVKAGSGKPEHTLKRTFPTKDEAQKAADAALKEGKASAETMSVEVVGNPFLKSEGTFTMPALEAEMAGAWIIQRAEHTCSKSQGYVTRLELERASE